MSVRGASHDEVIVFIIRDFILEEVFHYELIIVIIFLKQDFKLWLWVLKLIKLYCEKYYDCFLTNATDFFYFSSDSFNDFFMIFLQGFF